MVEKKICDILIRGTKYELFDIPGQEHNLGKMNNCPSTLWIKKEKDMFNEEEEYIPWIDIGTNRMCWGINIKQGNSMKYKYDSWDISGHIWISITLNNIQVYEFDANKLEFAFNEAQHLIYKLEEVPLNLDKITDGVGRPIYYKGLPCKIANRFDSGDMMINPDCKKEDLEKWWDSFTEPWYDDSDNDWLDEMEQIGEMKINILSEQIYWYRNDREVKLNKIKMFYYII